MGKTSKPLVFACDEELLAEEKITTLFAQGHTVGDLSLAPIADVILSRKAWRMFPSTMKYLDVTIKAARQIKYPAKKKGGTDAD